MMETLYCGHARIMRHEVVNHLAYLKSAVYSCYHKNLKIPQYAKTKPYICTTYRRGSRDIAPLIISALGGRFGGLLHALATLPQVKISCYPACLDKWRREKSLTPTGHGP